MAMATKIVTTTVLFVLLIDANPGGAADTKLKIAYNSDWPPYSMGAANSVHGILPDLIEEIISKKVGVEVEAVGYPWARVQHLVKSGYVDGFVTVPTKARLNYALSSNEIAYSVEMRAAVQTGSDAEKTIAAKPSPETLRSYRYCDIRANGWGKAYADKYAIQPVVASKVVSCLLMIQQGRVDVTLQSTVVAERAMRANGLEQDLTILPTVFGEMAFTFLLSKKSTFGQAFLDRFDKAVAEMKESGEYARLVRRIHDQSDQ